MASNDTTELEPKGLGQIIADMRAISDAIDEAHGTFDYQVRLGTSDYQVRLVSLALVARHFLRELAKGQRQPCHRCGGTGEWQPTWDGVPNCPVCGGGGTLPGEGADGDDGRAEK